jgi:glycosyltransferase involved in cell wall biosynthesis
MIRLVFIIRVLDAGGAERQLLELAKNLDPARFSIVIITFYEGGALEAAIEHVPHVQLLSARKSGRWDIVGFSCRMWRLVRAARPDVIHGYMYGANELALLLGRMVGAGVVWGLRSSDVDLNHYDGFTRTLFRTGAWLSSKADLIIANSEAGLRHHVKLGYPEHRIKVIPNGIDTAVYIRSEAGRRRLRAEWKVGDDETLVGIVGRLDPMKDHETFLAAAARAHLTAPRLRFAIVGAGEERARSQLETKARELGILPRVVWVGRRSDMAAVYSAFDIATSSSAFGEGFSNALGEAMACETLCVATRVGDAAMVLGPEGIIVPPKDPRALAEGWLFLLAIEPAEKARRRREARGWIETRYNTAVLANRTAGALCEVAVARHPALGPA